MNKKILFFLFFSALLSPSDTNTMDNKKRQVFNTKSSPAKRRKSSLKTDIDKEIEISDFILKNIKEKNVNELIKMSDHLFKNQLRYDIINSEIFTKRFFNHQSLFDFFSNQKNQIHTEKNQNIKSKLCSEWLKRNQNNF